MQKRLVDTLKIKKRSITPIARKGENSSKIRNNEKSKSIVRKPRDMLINSGSTHYKESSLNSLPLVKKTNDLKKRSQRLKNSRKTLNTEKNELVDSKQSIGSKVNNLNIDIKKKNLSKRNSSKNSISIRFDSEFKNSGSFINKKSNLESLELDPTKTLNDKDNNNKRSHHANLGFPETEKVLLNEKAKSMTQINKFTQNQLKRSLHIKKKALRSKTPIKRKE